MFQRLYSHIDKVSVVSFDIFDTLLLRPYVKPADMFIHLEKIYHCTGFAEQRMQAEKLFYQKNGTDKEANIDDIYAMIPDFTDMKQREMEWEFQTISINPEMLTVYEYAIKSGKKVDICSDMYLPLDFIKKLLKKNGITGYSRIYLSNAVNKRKDKGDMYGFMLQDLDIAASSVLHIVDNKKSDYIQAKKYGLKAFLYPKISDEFLAKNQKLEKFYKHQKGFIGASVAVALAAQRKQTDDYWIEFGYRYAAPVAYSYARFIYETALKKELDKVLFIARDGYLLEKVFNTFNKSIKTDYVYAPRILNYTANLDYNPYDKKQPRIVCEYFNKDCGNLSPQAFIEKNAVEFRELAIAEKEKTGYGKYIQKIIGTSNNIGVVDSISEQLSGQRLIEKEAHLKTTGFYFLTLSEQKCIYDTEHYDYLTSNLKDKFISNCKCDLVELIFSAPENPIITLCNGKPVHKTTISEAERTRQEIYNKIETGVLAFTQDVLKIFNGENIDFTTLNSVELLNAYVENPEKTDIRAMFSVKKSPYADNSEYIPLFSAPIPFWKVSKIKKLIWLTPLQRLGLILCTPVKFKMRGLKRIKIELFNKIPANIFKFSLFGRYELSIGCCERNSL